MSVSELLPIKGYEGLYSITSEGEVFSFRSNRYLKIQKNGRHYAVHMTDSEGKERRVNVHRLVAETFIPNPDCLPHVLHRNDDRTNNSVDNLYWGTPQQNRIDSVANGVHGYSKRSACIRGHEYTQENTYQSKTGRVCRECKTIYRQRAKEKQ